MPDNLSVVDKENLAGIDGVTNSSKDRKALKVLDKNIRDPYVLITKSPNNQCFKSQVRDKADMHFDSSDKFLDLSNVLSSKVSSELQFLVKHPDEQIFHQTLSKFCQTPQQFVHLKALDLTNTMITDQFLCYLTELSELEALGLSGTLVTTGGIDYLAKNAAFWSNLTCIKLCYLSNVDDSCIDSILQLINIEEIDLLGTNISLNGIARLVDKESGHWLQKLRILRAPISVFEHLRSLHCIYRSLRPRHLWPTFTLLEDLEQLDTLSRQEMIDQLIVYKKYYPNIYLNLPNTDLRSVLRTLIRSHSVYERLWNLINL